VAEKIEAAATPPVKVTSRAPAKSAPAVTTKTKTVAKKSSKPAVGSRKPAARKARR
jgi:hypothetical protein